MWGGQGRVGREGGRMEGGRDEGGGMGGGGGGRESEALGITLV